MKLFFSILFSLSLISFGQTKLIAFKSHSGRLSNFSISGFDNVGMPPILIDTILRLNDSIIVEISSIGWGKGGEFTDTIINHPVCKNPFLTVDSLKKIYNRDAITYIGFDTVLTKKEIRQQKKWVKNQNKLKKKRDELLKEYKEIDKKIVKSTGALVMDTDNNNDNTPNSSLIASSDKVYLQYFGLIGVMFFVFSGLYFYNRNKVIT